MTDETKTRRDFLRFAVQGIVTAAAVRTFPFRVFSFPSEIVIPTPVRRIWVTRKKIPLGLGDFVVQPMWDYFQVARNSPTTAQTLFNLDKVPLRSQS